ncbi:hypothetical protein N1937_04530 [Rhizobium sp. WSM4643]|nr:hypothetical protein [Rhizobium leguminosarum]UWM76511.1 hypothetical protein N1937_04530 [Rhizobium leguminosarum bv. viciae]
MAIISAIEAHKAATGIFAIDRRALLARWISALPLHAATEEDDENP